VPAAERHRTDERAAAAAFERIALVSAGSRAKREIFLGPPRWASGGPFPRCRERIVVVQQTIDVVWGQTWHACLLRSEPNDGQPGSNGTQARWSQNSLLDHDGRRGAVPRRERRRAEGVTEWAVTGTDRSLWLAGMAGPSAARRGRSGSMETLGRSAGHGRREPVSVCSAAEEERKASEPSQPPRRRSSGGQERWRRWASTAPLKKGRGRRRR
jgi:hypothetical protein